MKRDWLELSDRIVAFDPVTLRRRPVARAEVLADLDRIGDRRGRRIVEAIPACGEHLDPEAVDAELIACHYEIQRLALELGQGPRMARLVSHALSAVRSVHPETPLRVVDVGCGIGYVLRWMAAHRHVLPAGTELVGADFNPALIGEARRLAELEGLDVEFVVADAFAMEQPATVFMSSGVLHHVPDLAGFLGQQAAASVCIHADFQPSVLAPLGAWLLHAARMQRPLARYDGVLSAVRARTGAELRQAAKEGLPDWHHHLQGTHLLGIVPRAMHALVCRRPDTPW